MARSNRIAVAAACLNQVPLDWEGNVSRATAAVEEARNRGARYLCLPELALSGYGCEDMFLSPEVGEKALDALASLSPSCEGMVVAVGLPLWVRSNVFNAVALVVDGRVIGFVAKQNLAGDGLHYEPRWFKPWPTGVIDRLEWNGEELPLGDLIFDVNGIRIGFEICEDAWVASRPGTRLARRGVDVIFNPSASHFAFGKQKIRERFVLEGSRAFACAYVYANLLGNEAGRIIYDGGTMIAEGGKLVAAGERFSFRDWRVVASLVDLRLTRMHQARQVSHVPHLGDEDGTTVRVLGPGPSDPPTPSLRPDESLPRVPGDSKEEEFTRALALGLFDYLRKSRSAGFVVSLSGGADSGAIACLVRLMIDLATEELGHEGFCSRLGHITFGEASPAERLLTCVYQATRNSSQTTLEAARSVAAAIGARFFVWDIDELVEGYRERVEQSVGRPLAWERDDIALQNIQARVRAPGVWMLANVHGALLLSTSNRSEAAVGYATMDGDTSGGLSPIAGIDKAFLRHWLRWLECEALPPTIAPLPALRAINDQDPTAELRPGDRNQTDESDLMPYPVLDAIERLAIRDKKLPLEVWELLVEKYPGDDPSQLRAWVVLFFRLWTRNQWKRERYAPSFHLDDENLDPRTWCRFPILSSGFASEIEELESLPLPVSPAGNEPRLAVPDPRE